jgi:16S rRNA (adenine1518-N6/adenine1519-N6)-dimethyltransferase
MKRSIPSLFKEFSYRPRKTAGQNFLVDRTVLDRIEASIECPPEDLLLEVGGGYGALTERLIRPGRRVTVVEPDHKLFAMLEGRFGKVPGVSLVKADILGLDLGTLRPPAPGLLTVAGNIPYYLTTPLVTRFLTRYHGLLRRIFLMVQKEVADRMGADPGTKAYGALTLCVRYYAGFRRLVEAPARCFKPRPKVDSVFIELEPKREPALGPEEEKRFFTLVRAVFQSRRKTLFNSLKRMGKPAERARKALERSGLDPQVRGETLSMETLMGLSKALED